MVYRPDHLSKLEDMFLLGWFYSNVQVLIFCAGCSPFSSCPSFHIISKFEVCKSLLVTDTKNYKKLVNVLIVDACRDSSRCKGDEYRTRMGGIQGCHKVAYE